MVFRRNDLVLEWGGGNGNGNPPMGKAGEMARVSIETNPMRQ